MHVMSVNTMHKHDIKHDYVFISLITSVINYKFKRASQSNVQLNDNFNKYIFILITNGSCSTWL